MYLIVNKKTVWYTVVESEEVKTVDGDTAEGLRIPKNTVARCSGWYAGAGDVFYIKKIKSKLLIYRRMMDEGEEKDQKPILVKTISFN